MAYIGKEPQIGNYQTCDAISVVNGQAAYTMQVSSVNVVPESVNHMIVSLNGVLQKPGSSFTISGSTITFASNLATGDVIDFILLLGNVLDLGTPSDNTVATAKIVANAVTAAKFNADVISGQTALATAPADTDEFLVSDAGVLKRIDYSLIKGGGQKTLLSTTTVSSAVAEVDITSNIDSTYARYEITVDNFSCATHAAHLYMRFFQGGSIDSGSDYSWLYRYNQNNDTGDTIARGNSNDYMQILNEVRETVEAAGNFRLTLYQPANTATNTNADWIATYSRDGGSINILRGGAFLEQTAAVDGVRFYMSSGNIDSGVFKLYGIT
tara:strand:+ start:924 stop:1901 length:978 start_codon:yes stop_codon:yes gene_type:complete